MGIKSLFCLFTSTKFYFVRSIKRCFKWSPGTWNTYPSIWPFDNASCISSRMRCFKGSNDIFSLFPASLPAQNSTWLNSRKRCFKGSYVTLNSFPASGPSQNATWLRSRNNISRTSMAFSTYFRPLDQDKMRLEWSKKPRFLVVANHCELASWRDQNSIWMKSKKRCFMLSNVNLKSFSASLQD